MDSGKFNPTGYNDPVFAVAFLAQLAIVVGWCGYAAAGGLLSVVGDAATSGKAVVLLQGVRHGLEMAPGETDSLHYFIILSFLSLFTAVVFASIWMLLLKTFPVEMVKMSLLAFPAVMSVLLLSALAHGANVLWPAIGLACALAFVYMAWEKVDFTAAIVKTVVQTYEKAQLIYAIGLGVVVMQALWTIIWIISMIPVISGFASPAILLPLTLSFYWGVQVISNVLYVSAAGVVARFVYGQQTEEAAKKSFEQACTSLFGSICFGSLLIAIIQTLRNALKSSTQEEGGEENAAAAACRCVAQYLLQCLEHLVQIFNEFAFCYVAIYGLDFQTAAKKTYQLITSTDALTSDTITNLVTACGCLGVALLCAGFNAFTAWRLSLSQNYVVGSAVVAGLSGFVVMCVVSRIVEGGCTTMIICFEEEGGEIDDDLKALFCERTSLKNKPR